MIKQFLQMLCGHKSQELLSDLCGFGTLFLKQLKWLMQLEGLINSYACELLYFIDKL